MERLKIDINYEKDNDLLNKMMEAYKNCPTVIKYLNDLGVPDDIIFDNITKIYDFVSDVNYCKNCPGCKACAKENPLLCTKIIYRNGVIERELVPCKEFLKRVSFEQTFKVRDFPEEWLDKTMRDVDKASGRVIAMNKYAEYLKKEINNWIYLTGGANSGRTFLAAMLCVDAAKRGKGPVAFLNTQNRVQELYDLSFKDKEKFQARIEKYSNMPILVFDDFGNEFKNDFIRDAIIFPIINNRVNKKLFTIVTSDFKISEIVDLYSTSKAATIRAKQIGSLIQRASGEEISLGDLPIY